MTFPLVSSVYRLADYEVLIAVAQTPDGPAPLFTDVGGEVACVAYTDLREAQGDAPSTHRLFSIVVADLLGQLPEHVGLVVDPRAASPVHVGAQDKARISAAARPFPNGAQVAIRDPAEEPAALTTRLRELAPGRLPSAGCGAPGTRQPTRGRSSSSSTTSRARPAPTPRRLT